MPRSRRAKPELPVSDPDLEIDEPAGGPEWEEVPPHYLVWRVWPGWLRPVLRMLRLLLAIGVMRISGAPRRPTDRGEPLYSRAILETAEIEERYSYEQENFLSRRRRPLSTPTGTIELRLPYDGSKYFTRQAYADVIRIRKPGAGERNALVGHLTLTGYGHTNLDGLLGLSETYGSVPVRVPIPVSSGKTGPADLKADRSTRVFRCDYEPQSNWPKTRPIEVQFRVIDPDSTMNLTADATVDGADEITQLVTFRPELWLEMTVLVHLAAEPSDDVPAEVTQVTVKWPTDPSLREMGLSVNGASHPVRYNPYLQSLEWSDVRMHALDDSPVSGVRTYSSGPMVLAIPQPGDLYQERDLTGWVEVKVGKLLSGVDARLFGARGAVQRRPKLDLHSVITHSYQLMLDEGFAKRSLTSYHHLHFDDVVPTEMRISDIKIALINLGFRVDDPQPDDGPQARLLRAERYEGPDRLELELYVQGHSYQAQRDTRVPGGVTYRSNQDSGEIRIYVRGRLPRDSAPVVHEINALRRALCERFDHLPARR